METKLFVAGLVLSAANAFGAVYYVATDGNDSNAGSQAKPFATLKKANAVVAPGDTVWVRGGTYYLRDTTYARNDGMSAGILLNRSGESDSKRIHYLAYPGELPIFDGTNLMIGQAYSHTGSVDSTMYTSAILIQASYLHLKGFEVRNVPMKYNSNVGVYISRSKHIFLEQINSHHNKGAGFFVNERGTGSGGGHYFLNCDSHDNYDPNGRQGDGENADGFGVHYQTTGDTTKFYGCRAWWNSDDGWDFISQEFPVVIENSFAMGHGYSDYGTKHPANANGNGFKAGSSQAGTGRHIIKNCVAWNNYSSGFYANHSSVGNYWYNNTSYNNRGNQFNMWASSWDAAGNRTDGVVLTGANAHVMKNNVAFPNKTAYIGGEYASGEYNTWNLNITPANSDFVSVADPSLTTTGKDISALAGALGPRKPDGSLPDIDFLKLKSGSQMIDRGTDVGIPFVGKAPDLGAYEYGAASSSSLARSSSSAPATSSSQAYSSSSSAKSSSSVVTTSSSTPASSSSTPATSSSVALTSSSAEGTTSLAGNLPSREWTAESVQVFDMQGRFLGTLHNVNAANIARELRSRYGNPGIYFVRAGRGSALVTVRAF